MIRHTESAPVEGSLKSLIDTLAREILAGAGVRTVEISPGADHDGDPVLFVDIFHDLSEAPIEPATLTQLLTRLRDELIRNDERRFPMVRHHFAETQTVVGYQ